MKYEILEHTADLKIRVFGKTKEELFLNGLLAMEECLKPACAGRPGVKQEAAERYIKIKALDLSALLVDFLSEALYLNQTEKEIYNKVKFLKFTDNEIEAKLVGKKVESFDEDIKAVTYHSLDVHQKKDGIWEATVLFDV